MNGRFDVRRLRTLGALLVAGSVAVAAGCGGGEAAGNDGQVPVVGTGTFVEQEIDGTETTVGDVIQGRDSVWIFEQDMSDARLSGTVRVSINYDMHAGGIADMWGTSVITNDGGTWEGDWIGSIRGDDTHLLYMPYAGTGDYAGFRYIDFGVFDEPSGEFTSDTVTAHAGWIEPVE
jgi:hypothetical protein